MNVTWSFNLSFPSDLAFKSGFPRTFKPLISTYKDAPPCSTVAALGVVVVVGVVGVRPPICGVVGVVDGIGTGVVDGIGTGVCLTVVGDEGNGVGVVEYDCGMPFGLLIVEGGGVLGSATGAVATVRGGSGGTVVVLRVAAGDETVSIKLTELSVALRKEASSFFFLQRDAPQRATQRMKMAITAVSIFGKKFLISEDFLQRFSIFFLLYEIWCCQIDLLHLDNQRFTFMTNYAFQGVGHVQSTF